MPRGKHLFPSQLRKLKRLIADPGSYFSVPNGDGTYEKIIKSYDIAKAVGCRQVTVRYHMDAEYKQKALDRGREYRQGAEYLSNRRMYDRVYHLVRSMSLSPRELNLDRLSASRRAYIKFFNRVFDARIVDYER